jgi:hypothetical protein
MVGKGATSKKPHGTSAKGPQTHVTFKKQLKKQKKEIENLIKQANKFNTTAKARLNQSKVPGLSQNAIKKLIKQATNFTKKAKNLKNQAKLKSSASNPSALKPSAKSQSQPQPQSQSKKKAPKSQSKLPSQPVQGSNVNGKFKVCISAPPAVSQTYLHEMQLADTLHDYVSEAFHKPKTPKGDEDAKALLTSVHNSRIALSKTNTNVYSKVICDVLDEIAMHRRSILRTSESTNLCARLNKYYKMDVVNELDSGSMFTDKELVSRYIRPHTDDVDGCKFSIFSVLRNHTNFKPDRTIDTKKLAENVLNAIHTKYHEISVINDVCTNGDKRNKMIDNIKKLIESYGKYMLTPKSAENLSKDPKVVELISKKISSLAVALKTHLPKLSLSIALTPLCSNLRPLLNLDIRTLGERLTPDQQQTHLNKFFRNKLVGKIEIKRCYLTLCDIKRFNLEHKLNVAMLTFTFGLFSRVKGKSAKALLQGGYSPIKYALGCMSLAPSEAAPNLRKSDLLFVIYDKGKFIVDKVLWKIIMGFDMSAETEEHFQIIADLFNLVMIRLFEYYRTHGGTSLEIEPIQLFIILSVCLFFTNTPFPLIYIMFKDIDMQTSFNHGTNSMTELSNNSGDLNAILAKSPTGDSPAALPALPALAAAMHIDSASSHEAMNENEPVNVNVDDEILAQRDDDPYNEEVEKKVNNNKIIQEAIQEQNKIINPTGEDETILASCGIQ